MHSLSEQQILYIWELGQYLHPIDKALIILGMAYPDVSRNELASMPKGQRDLLLFAVREQIFGSRFTCLTICKACNEQLEVVFNSREVVFNSNLENRKKEYYLKNSGYHIKYRLPNSYDLAAIVKYSNLTKARDTLLKRCVLSVDRNGKKTYVSRLPKKAVAALSNKMAEIDPLAEIKLNLKCTLCNHQWDMNFDIVTFLWNEISLLAHRLMHEVHVLARYYGWHEDNILSMSSARRLKYLEMVI